MKKYFIILLLVILGLTSLSAEASAKRKMGCMVDKALGCEIAEERKDTVYQFSIFDAYLQGYYKTNDNKVTLSRQYGDFGIGLLKNKEGAMIFLDDINYKVKDFQLVPLREDEYVPIAFGMFKYFDVDDKITIKKAKNLDELNNILDKKLETLNYFAAIKAKGKFNSILLGMPDGTTKTVNNIKGTFVGFRVPDFYTTAPKKYTYYFVSDDLSISAKVLDTNVELLSCAIDYTNRLELILPKNRSFKQKDFNQYEPKVQDTTDKKLSNPTFQRDREKMMSTPKGEPTPEEMMQLLTPKATW